MCLIRRCTPADHDSIRAMLHRAALPTSDLTAEKLRMFLVVIGEQGEISGCGGLEIFADQSLLRSLAVIEAARARGLGSRLVQRLEQWAIDLGLSDLWLLTETAAAFFVRLGYTQVERGAAPDEIKKTSEFRLLCPDSAVCFHKSIGKGKA